MTEFQVPDFIEKEIPKVYGASVLDNIPNEDSDDAFNDIVDGTQIEADREELKSSDIGKVNATVTTDAINGIKTSTVNDDEELQTIEAILNEQDIRGRTITNSGKAMIKDLLKEDPTEDELKKLSNAFNNWVNNNYNKDFIEHDIDITEIEETLGNKISEKIKSITVMDPDSYESVLRRFAFQLYNTYQKVVQYNDDMKQLSKLAKKVNEYSSSIKDSNDTDPSEINKAFDDITNMSNDISEFLSKMSALDDRNRRLKQSYSLDDYDIRTVEDVKKCLEDALSFIKPYSKIDCATVKLRKEYKDKKAVNRSIENWISDIRNDSTTLFTFPVNDYLTIEESRKQLISYVENSFYGDIIVKNNIVVPDDTTDIAEFLTNKGMIGTADAAIIRTKAKVLLYVLSRTFKHKQLTSVNERRILSYTLEMLSKLGIEKYRTKILELANYAYANIVAY